MLATCKQIPTTYYLKLNVRHYQRPIKNGQYRDNTEKLAKYGTQDKGQSKMDNTEKLAIYGTQDKGKHNTICVGHHYDANKHK